VSSKTNAIDQQLNRIQLLLLDVDGVLTDGSIVYNDDGIETKAFHVKDGLGLRLLMSAGIEVGIVTGRRSGALHNRCLDLKIKKKYIFDNVKDKAAILDTIAAKTNISEKDMAFIGDDLPDIPLMKKIGLPIAVADAHAAVIGHAAIITKAKGGKGAVREICEEILKAKGLWQGILEKF
jgi:3-deoxy-D-manno-octulosonate 8-phosphate phosphatase (KDO 8-P phosphatase)